MKEAEIKKLSKLTGVDEITLSMYLDGTQAIFIRRDISKIIEDFANTQQPTKRIVSISPSKETVMIGDDTGIKLYYSIEAVNDMISKATQQPDLSELEIDLREEFLTYFREANIDMTVVDSFNWTFRKLRPYLKSEVVDWDVKGSICSAHQTPELYCPLCFPEHPKPEKQEGDKTKNGLYGKYIIQKANGKPIDDNAKYFVLRYDKDIHAKIALRAYAESVRNENPELYNHLDKLTPKQEGVSGEVIRKEALRQVEEDYNNKNSQHYRDNERYTWAINAINNTQPKKK